MTYCGFSGVHQAGLTYRTESAHCAMPLFFSSLKNQMKIAAEPMMGTELI
jgi:hypothetical protein